MYIYLLHGIFALPSFEVWAAVVGNCTLKRRASLRANYIKILCCRQDSRARVVGSPAPSQAHAESAALVFLEQSCILAGHGYACTCPVLGL